MSDTTVPPPGVFSCSPSSSVNLQHASLTLDHPPIYQSLVFISSPSPSFSRHPSLCCSSSPFSILFPSTTHSAFITSLSFPSLFFFFISVTAVSTGFVMWDSYSHILFSSPRRQQCHTTAAENRGRADTGGRGGRVTRGLLALICVKNAVGQIFSRFNVSVCYSEVRGVRQLLVGVFFRKTGTKCEY